MDVGSWLEAYRKAWEDKDADAAAALFDEGSTYRSNIFEEPYEGPEGVRRYWLEVTRTQEDVRVLMGRPFATTVRTSRSRAASCSGSGRTGSVSRCASIGTSSRAGSILRPSGGPNRRPPAPRRLPTGSRGAGLRATRSVS